MLLDKMIKEGKSPRDVICWLGEHLESLPLELVEKYKQYVARNINSIGSSYHVLWLYENELITPIQVIEWGQYLQCYSEIWECPEVRKHLPADFDNLRAFEIQSQACYGQDQLNDFVKGDSRSFIQDIAVSAFAAGDYGMGHKLLKSKKIPPTDDILHPKTKGFYAFLF